MNLHRIQERVSALEWRRLEADLNARGYAVTPSLLSESECAGIAALYAEDALFRKTIKMARHSYGDGEYRYFAEPVAEPVARLRESRSSAGSASLNFLTVFCRSIIWMPLRSPKIYSFIFGFQRRV